MGKQNGLRRRWLLGVACVLAWLAIGTRDGHAQVRWDVAGAFSHTQIAIFDLYGASFDTSARIEVIPQLWVGGRTGFHIMGSERFWKFELGDLRVGEGLGVIPLLAEVEYAVFPGNLRPVVNLGLGIYGAGFINQRTTYRLCASPMLGLEWGPVTFYARYERLFGEVLNETVDYFSWGIRFRLTAPRGQPR